MAFECLAGHRPFDADSPVATALAHLNDPVPDLPPEVPADLAAVVRRAMAKEPDQRYADGDAFAAALRDPAGAAATAFVPIPTEPAPSEHTQVLAPIPLDPTPTPVPEPGDDRRSPWLIVLLVLALVAAIVLIIVVATQANDDNDDPTESDTSSAPTSSAPTTEDTPTEESSTAPAEVQIDEDDYVGRNVDAVATELRAKGLEVDTQPIDNPGDEEADTVASVSPTDRPGRGRHGHRRVLPRGRADLRAADHRAHVGAADHRADQPDRADLDRVRRPEHPDPDDVRPRGRARVQIRKSRSMVTHP